MGRITVRIGTGTTPAASQDCSTPRWETVYTSVRRHDFDELMDRGWSPPQSCQPKRHPRGYRYTPIMMSWHRPLCARGSVIGNFRIHTRQITICVMDNGAFTLARRTNRESGDIVHVVSYHNGKSVSIKHGKSGAAS